MTTALKVNLKKWFSFTPQILWFTITCSDFSFCTRTLMTLESSSSTCAAEPVAGFFQIVPVFSNA